MKKILDKKNIIPVVILILVIGGALFFSRKSIRNNESEMELNNYADQIIEACKSERYHPACYDREIPKLMDSISMEDTFKVTEIIQGKDSSYPFCHTLGHELSAREVRKDPSKWKDVLARVPSGVCSNGGIHGAFQERFRAESLPKDQIEKIKPELMDVCEKRPGFDPTGTEQGSCYHALGHLSMYVTEADVNYSLGLCDALAKKSNHDFSQVCYDGVFMQIYQPLETEDTDLVKDIKVVKGDPEYFCKQFHGTRRGSCWSESWPLVYAQIMQPQGLMDHCGSNFLEKQADKERCFLGLFYVVVAQMKFDPVKLNNFCSGLPEARSVQCFPDVASRMIETDYRNIPRAVSFCNGADKNNRGACFSQLINFSSYNFHKGSTQFLDLCNSLPEEWKNDCLSRQGAGG